MGSPVAPRCAPVGSGLAHDGESEAPTLDVPTVKKKLETIKDFCKSEIPPPLHETFSLLRKHLHHYYYREKVAKSSKDYRLLRDVAYDRALVTVTHTILWPWRTPSPKSAVWRILRTVKKRHEAAKEADKQGINPGKSKKLNAQGSSSARGMLVVRGVDQPLALRCAHEKGKHCDLAPHSGSATQLWYLDKASKAIAPLSTQIDLVLDVEGWAENEDTDNEGKPVILWEKLGQKNQKWRITSGGEIVSNCETGDTNKGFYLGWAPAKIANRRSSISPDMFPKAGVSVVMVGKSSKKKLYWKWLEPPKEANGGGSGGEGSTSNGGGGGSTGGGTGSKGPAPARSPRAYAKPR